jgi:hypothetical protein
MCSFAVETWQIDSAVSRQACQVAQIEDAVNFIYQLQEAKQVEERALISTQKESERKNRKRPTKS